MSNSQEKKTRKRFSTKEVKILENAFSQSINPGSSTKIQLAKEIGTSVRRVQVWFQNHRAKLKRQEATQVLTPTSTSNPPPPPPLEPTYHQPLQDQRKVTEDPSSSTSLLVNEPYAETMTERMSTIIQRRQTNTEVAPVLFYSPYAIDTSSFEHQRYYSHPFQKSSIIHPLPQYATTQHQPPCLRPVPQIVPSYYTHDEHPLIDNMQTHPGKCIPVVSTPTVPYFLSHENQQSQHLRYHHHHHHHLHRPHHRQQQQPHHPCTTSI